MNRGIAHRPAFESRADIRMFLAQVARVVRARSIEVHAYCVLQTHYHLLVRSLDGTLSIAMQRIQNEYVRWFNQTRGRDGPLFRGRFHSRPVTSEDYKRTLVRYIDDNPFQAGITGTAYEYPHGSAHSYVHRAGPRWLTRTWLESLVVEETGLKFAGGSYRRVFGRPATDQERARLARAIESGTQHPGDLESIPKATADEVQQWLRIRARVADGGFVGPSVCLPRDVEDAIGACDDAGAGTQDRQLGHDLYAIRVALLFELCGLSHSEIVTTIGRGRSSVSNAHRMHRRCIVESEKYASLCCRVAWLALRQRHPQVDQELGIQRRINGLTEKR